MLKKIFLLTFIFIFCPKITDVVPFQNITEIFVIGTVHENTVNFNSDTLLNIFNKIKPDVILIECDTSYMTPDNKLKGDVKYAFLETKAVSLYSDKNSVEMRPYDIEGRDNFLDDSQRKTNEADFFNDITEMYENGKFNDAAVKIYEKIKTTISLAGVMSLSTVSFINSSEGASNIDTINFYTYKGLQILINETPELSKYKQYWDDEVEFGEKRNKTMLKNILKYENYFNGKKIVVLCGFAHRNILKTGLLKKSDDRLVIKEFWEN